MATVKSKLREDLTLKVLGENGLILPLFSLKYICKLEELRQKVIGHQSSLFLVSVVILPNHALHARVDPIKIILSKFKLQLKIAVVGPVKIIHN